MPPLSEKEKIAHLLRRFGLGASEAEIAYYGKGGLAGAINALLDESRPDGFDFPVSRFAQKGNNLNMRGAQAWWVARMLLTQNPLKEKLTLFWHDHFATSGQKVDSGNAMVAQNETIRGLAYGRFEDLLLAMSKDPAMIYWLDNQLNLKGKPNENFAREVMELFTLGVGNYSEKDVQEAARAFTGWGYGRRGQNRQTTQELRVPRGATVFYFDVRQHDEGVKTILGNTGPFNGDDVVGVLVGNPRTAEYIAEKMWEFFAHEKPNNALVTRLANKYRSNGLRASVLVRAIMESPEFYSESAVRKVYKNPVDFCIATLRQLGLGAQLKAQLELDAESAPGRGMAIPGAVITAMKAMGMELMFPPDVAGWEWGESWVSTATMVERLKWADRLFGIGRGANFRYPVGSLIPGTATSREFVQALCSLFDVTYSEAKMRSLVAAADKAAADKPVANRPQMAVAVSRLIFGSPEFQFC